MSGLPHSVAQTPDLRWQRRVVLLGTVSPVSAPDSSAELRSQVQTGVSRPMRLIGLRFEGIVLSGEVSTVWRVQVGSVRLSGTELTGPFDLSVTVQPGQSWPCECALGDASGELVIQYDAVTAKDGTTVTTEGEVRVYAEVDVAETC